MFPQFEFLGKTFSMYAICALIGVLFALFVPYFFAQKRAVDEVRYVIMMLIAFASALIGAHLLYGIVNYDKIILFFKVLDQVTSFEVFVGCMAEIFGGAVFYGGLITGMIGGYIYIRKVEKDIAPYTDLGAVAIPLFHGFGRIGCFLAGCCYGVESSCGITFHHSIIDSANGVPRFPVQLVESGLNFILFSVLLYLFCKKRFNGKLIFLYLIIYPVCRFILEFFRGDTYRGFVGFLSTSQIVSILLIVFSLLMLLVLRRKEKPRNGDQTTPVKP